MKVFSCAEYFVFMVFFLKGKEVSRRGDRRELIGLQCHSASHKEKAAPDGNVQSGPRSNRGESSAVIYP